MKNRKVVITRRGGPETLRVVREDLPVPGTGRVRVRIEAAGVAFADLMMREGIYPGSPPFPFAPGYDIVGRVDSLGVGVDSVRVGQRVAALTVFGGYADYFCLPADDLVTVPEGLDSATAVCLVLNYLTAWQMLHRTARIERGDTILVHGAAGGVGTALLELGRLHDARCIGTSSAGKHDIVRNLGGEPIDYRGEDFVARVRDLCGGSRVDAVFDPIGGGHWRRSYSTLGFGGILVGYGFYGGTSGGRRSLVGSLVSFIRNPGFSVLDMVGSSRRVAGYSVSSLKRRRQDWYREDLATLLDLCDERKLSPLIAERLPLEQASRAHELLGGRAVCGKIVLVTGD